MEAEWTSDISQYSFRLYTTDYIELVIPKGQILPCLLHYPERSSFLMNSAAAGEFCITGVPSSTAPTPTEV